MKHKWTLMSVALVAFSALVFVSACSNGAEAAAKNGYAQWVKNTGVIERNAKFEINPVGDASAIFNITAEFQNPLDGSWEENQATGNVLKRGNDWLPPTSFAFFPSPRAVKTQEAIRNLTATVETARREATFIVQATASNATAEARATNALVETQEAANTQATLAVEATQQAVARKTTIAQRITSVDKPMSFLSVGRDSSEFRGYYKNIEFKVVGVERADDNSVLWHFSLWNHNPKDTIHVQSSRPPPYMVSSDGVKYDALQWQGIEAVAGEKKEWVIAFNAPANSGLKYTLFMTTFLQTNNYGIYAEVTWQPFEVTLR